MKKKPRILGRLSIPGINRGRRQIRPPSMRPPFIKREYGGSQGYRGPDWWKARQKAIELSGHKCQGCGARGKRFVVDHIVPYYISRDNSPSNLRVLCYLCNAHLEVGVRKRRT